MNRPIHNRGANASLGQDGNYGLWFDRFFDRYQSDYNELHSDGFSSWLEDFTQQPVGDELTIRQQSQRQAALCHSQNGRFGVFSVDWHFVTGTGIPHAIENGFTWHPTLGTPYLPASSVKGLVRHIFETAYDYKCDNHRHQWMLDIFGSTEKNTTGKSTSNQAGGIIFFDAIPIAPVQLGKDVMTPHAAKWYQNGGSISAIDKASATLPADWNDPTPITWLGVHEANLLFCIAPRKQSQLISNVQLEQIWQTLEYGLGVLGAGAKTTSGYGRMTFNKTLSNQFSEILEKQTAAAEKARAVIAGEHAKKRMLEEEKQTKATELARMSPVAREIEEIIEANAAKKDPLKEVVKLLDSGHWTEPPVKKEVASIVKDKWMNTDQWIPEFTGGNKDKTRQAKRCKNIQSILDS